MRSVALPVIVAAMAAAVTSPSAVGAVPGRCGTIEMPPPAWEHVVWIWFENHGYDQIVGSSDAPFMNELARTCGLATSYRAITHPSLPNYIAATSGLAGGALDRFGHD